MELATSEESYPVNLKAMVDAFERRVIQEALRATHGNQRRAAAALGVLPTTLHEKMKRLGLLPRSVRASLRAMVAAEPIQN
jgi:DNA-binding NtrC family response regulator